MSLARSLLLSLSALLVVPTIARAEDDEVCVGWVHVFLDATHDNNKFTVTSQSTCLSVAATIDEGEPFADGKPYRGGAAEWRYDGTCRGLARQIDEMSRVLRQAKALLPGATKTRDASVDTAAADFRAYEIARAAWEAAQAALELATAAYEDVYEVVVETERDRQGRVVVVRELGYDESTPLGRAVAEAREDLEKAREAMDAAWERWSSGSSPGAQTAQSWVDYYSSVVSTTPGELEAARARWAELGCK